MRCTKFLTSSLACLIAVASVSTSMAVLAEEQDETKFGMDISAGRQHQVFADSSANLDTIALQPYVQFGNWDVSIDVPWQRAQGEYFVNSNFQPAPSYRCQQYSGLTSTQQTRLANRYPKLAQRLATTCTTTSTSDSNVSGLSDVTLFAHYSTPLDSDGVWLGSVGLGYKADNGDVETGLGSGTSDARFEASLSALVGKFSGTVLLGYDTVLGGEQSDGVDNYAYASLDLSLRPLRWLTLGGIWNYEQAYVDGTDNLQSVSAYVGLKPLDSLSFRLYYKDYLDVEAYPEHEVGGSVTYSF